MIGPKLAVSDEFTQAINKEILKMQKVIQENKDLRINDYIDFRHKF